METLDELIDTNPLLSFADELTREVVGSSRRRWALVLVAFLAGGALVLWLARKRAAPAKPDAEPIGA